MRRRDFIGLIGGATAWPVFAQAQQGSRIPVVGILWHGSAEKEWANPFYHYIHDGFASHGYVSGKTIKFEERYANENQDRYDQLAYELVALNPDLLMGLNVPAALTLKKTTSRIPIVIIGVTDPVGLGLVESFARPGGNVTGMANVGRETYLKRVQILKQLVPGLSRLALLADMEVPAQVTQETEHYAAAAVANGVQLEVFSAHDGSSIDQALEKMVAAKCDGVAISQQGIFYLQREEISKAALVNRLPTMGPSEAFVPSGILIAYSAIIKERFAEYVAYAVRILRGEKPSELPMMFPTTLKLALNLKTAAALNLTIPTTLLASVDELVQ